MDINKKYNIIYADPPWSFSSKELQKYDNKRFTSMDKHYSTQSKDWIKNLSVKNITEKNSCIFLWVTDAHIKEGIEVMESWGFKYVTIAFIWEKVSKNGITVANLGSWTMKNYEICLFGTKGKMLQYKKCNNIYQKVVEERNKHSKKPQQVRDNIVKIFPNLPRIELFARQKVEGWDCWGNQIEEETQRKIYGL